MATMDNPPTVEPNSLELQAAAVVDEFLERLKGGEALNVEDFARQHPPLEDLLRQVLPALLALEPPGATPGDTPDQPPALGRLGDFEIVREAGRGGMGVVYEARQLSLGRRVALKVLPFAAALDPRQLQRFRNEAHAAAQLHHQHIVPVYAVGCERSVHYYAMQFIEGQTLAALVGELRREAGLKPVDALASTTAPPGGPAVPPPEPAAETGKPAAGQATERSITSPVFFRTAARLGVQTAEALEHAHQLGVVHRDIKPANLLVDGRGQVWVTDFGLAQFHSDVKLTLSGDLVGTLRYMSPEQTRGRRLAVDQRTDVYSLGVTLYELLTLEPAFPSRDRAELLRQIAGEEPRPPRRLNRAVPVELETIVLKAMARSPAERYASAQELADDLQRFLDDRAIRARRPTLGQRLKRWARRHQTLVGVISAGLVVALLAGGVLLWRDKQQAEAAYEAEARQRRRAQDNQALAFRALDEIFITPALLRSPRNHRLAQLDRQVLRKGLRFYEELARRNSADPAGREEAARAYWRVGILGGTLGRYGQARAGLLKAVGGLQELAREFPGRTAYREQLAQCSNHLGALFGDHGRPGAAERWHRQALALYQQLAADFPAKPVYRHGQAVTWVCLGETLTRTGDSRQAERAYRRSLALFAQVPREGPDGIDCRLNLAVNYHHQGLLLMARGQLASAQRAFEQGLTLTGALLAESPENVFPQRHQALALVGRAALRRILGRPGEAEKDYGRALVLQEKVAARFRNVPTYQRELAGTLIDLASLLGDRGQRDQARRLLERAVGLQQAVEQRASPDDRRHLYPDNQHVALAGVWINLGNWKEAEAVCRQAVTLYQGLAARAPKMRRYREHLAASYATLALARGQAGTPREARRAYRQALAVYERLRAEFPDVPEYPARLGTIYTDLGNLLRPERPRESEQAYRQALALREKLAADFPRTPEHRHGLALVCNNLVAVLGRGRPREAAQFCRRAEALLEQLIADCPEMHFYRLTLAGVLTSRGRLLRSTGQPRAAEQAFLRARAIYEGQPAEVRQASTYRGAAALNSSSLGQLLWEGRRHREAEQAFRHAVALAEEQRAAEPAVPAHQENLAAMLYALARLREDTGQYRESEQTYLRALPLYEKLAAAGPAKHQKNLALTLAGVAVRRTEDGRPREATGLFARATRLQPGNLQFWIRRALAHLAAGEADAYRRVCAEMLERFGKTTDAMTASLLVYLCVTDPGCAPDRAQLLALARRGAAGVKGNVRLLAAARYRAGEYQAALHCFDEAGRGSPHRPWDWLFVAMARQRLGQVDGARQALAQAVRGVDQVVMSWMERAQVKHLRREAEALLTGNTAGKKP
jgi:serine/threonine protein kinase